MSLSIKVKSVKPLEDMILLVEFENGIKKIYDIKRLIPQFGIYEDLKYNDLFDQAHVDCGGYAVAWNSDIDISECELWENGIKAKE
ncbi:MAG: DUF2442 domain-containing protein [Oscillospiraceae bacterium]|nr:DUF2442 domain-containing protein [Oscillospiraceae bacterium]